MERNKFNAILAGAAGGGFALGAGLAAAGTYWYLTRKHRAEIELETNRVRDYYRGKMEEAYLVSYEDRHRSLESEDNLPVADPETADDDGGQSAVGNPSLDGILGEPDEVSEDHLEGPTELLPDSSFIDLTHSADHEKVEEGTGSDSDQVTSVMNEAGKKPTQLTLEQFCDPPAGFQQCEVTYYAADRVLVDDHQQPIPNINRTVGRLTNNHFGGVSKDPLKRYVRNYDLQIDFEIILNKGSFADLILNYGRPD